ncbi:hypothetical protein ACIGW0_31410 [Streptomyces bikiniensis]|uniref:Uncharacterized protein n=1 Tax=Streptomyces bikiniensis TaxID=1896 RepID=A0ABW8D1W8_STRBI
MALWLVSRTDDTDYDEYSAIVVRAADEETARRIATHGEERASRWHADGVYWEPAFLGFERDGSNLTVERLGARGPAGLILASFRAG